MRLLPLRVEAEIGHADGHQLVAEPSPSFASAVALGPLELALEPSSRGVRWSVANRGDLAVTVRSVTLTFELAEVRLPVRMYRHGYQSWSPTGVATLGVDADPSTLADFEFIQAAHHADQRRARLGELRSEWVTLLADAGGGGPLLLGFDGGHRHDGTFRLRSVGQTTEVRAEAFLGDAVLRPGASRDLHALLVAGGDGSDGRDLLAGWADQVGRAGGARTDAPYRVGWCSWYQYFHDVTEDDLRANLARCSDWPFEVVQLDDGYQAAIGDWLATNDRFPSGLDGIAGAVAAEGRTPGLWLAPFLVAPDAEVARAHPDWLARHVEHGVDRGPLRTWWNPPWGGGDEGFMYGLDTTHPEVLAHLRSVAAAVVSAGFSFLKLDFTFSPSLDGGYADPGRTPAERVRAGFDAVRQGAGEDAFLLGCGVPLANVVGVVDANRIGPDVAPVWSLTPGDEVVPGYLGMQPAAAHAFQNTLTRAFTHRRLWLNDPDCLLLRTVDTRLSAAAARTWAHAVGLSGGMAVVSDDLALLDGSARSLLEEVVTLGRASDAEARAGRGARCPDLLEEAVPGRLEVAGHRLVADPTDGTSHLTATGEAPR